jgi:uncharacterized membrane protein
MSKAWAVVPLAFAAAALAVPYCSSHGWFAYSFPLSYGFSLVCHQRPERCFWIFGAPVAVCARCFGIYLGAAIGLLPRVARRSAIQWLTVATALNLTEWLTELAGVHGSWIELRFVLGFLLGAAAGVLLGSSRESSARLGSHLAHVQR